MPSIYLTVTTDLNYDQRMIRICTSLTHAGYEVKLIGRKLKASFPLSRQPFGQMRLGCFFEKGKLSYAEYNARLFLYLLFKKMNAICAIDLDTIVPCYYISRLKKIPRVYDAHEYFTQMKEVISRPRIYKIWHWVEKKFLPKFKNGYTVSPQIAEAFQKEYGVNYHLIRNIPLLRQTGMAGAANKKILLYQGAVNEGRGFEGLVPAMKNIPAELYVYGDGNYLEQLKKDVAEQQLSDKILLKGKLLPQLLDEITRQAYIGLNLVEAKGLNQLYSLANKFFDYIQHALPQVTMNFPGYAAINNEFEVAVLVDDTEPGTLSAAINRLLEDQALYQRLQDNCTRARETLNWQEEEKKLLAFYKHILG